MNGDIALYEVRVTDPAENYFHRGRMRPNGRTATCVHRLFVAAYSRQSAESLARHHCFRKLGRHVDDVCVYEVTGNLHDLGMFAYKTRDMQVFKLRCDASKPKEEEAC
jgi:hypothetical protein